MIKTAVMLTLKKGGYLRMMKELFFVFLFGGVTYSFIEIAYRGRTHWSMTLTGGVVFVLLYWLNIKLQPNGLLVRCLIGCIAITCIEFLVGCVVNRLLHLGVWDYSHQPLNLLGQICPAFSGIWFALCIPADLLCGYMHRTIFS